MWNDPIVEEIHAIRIRLADECGNDLHASAERFRAQQDRYAARVITYAPRRPAGWTPPIAPVPNSIA